MFRKRPKAGTEMVHIIQGSTWTTLPIESLDQQMLRAGGQAYPREAVQEFTKPGGGIVYAVNPPKEIAVAAQKLGELMDSVILRNVFAYRQQEKVWTPVTIICLGLILVLAIAFFRR